MSQNLPLVSIVMTTYNHEDFVGEAIESVLCQTLKNFEFIIVDDCSSDTTQRVIRRYKDPRIKFIPQKERQGPSIAFNRAAKHASGKYIALFSGDDVCHPNRLNAQATILNEGYGDLVFAIPEIIDSYGHVNQISPFRTIFRSFHHQESQFRSLFFDRNYLCAPTAMMRLNTWRRFGGFHPALLQLQDFELWLRLAKHGTLFANIDMPLVSYRVRDDEGNLSSKQQNIRTLNEYQYIYKHIFDDLSPEQFLTHFRNDLSEKEANALSYRDQKNVIYLKHTAAHVRVLGIQDIFLQNQPSSNKDIYNGYIPILGLFELCNNIDTFNSGQVSALKKTLIEHKTT